MRENPAAGSLSQQFKSLRSDSRVIRSSVTGMSFPAFLSLVFKALCSFSALQSGIRVRPSLLRLLQVWRIQMIPSLPSMGLLGVRVTSPPSLQLAVLKGLPGIMRETKGSATPLSLAQLESIDPISQGMVQLPGSLSLGGISFLIRQLQFSLKEITPSSWNFSLFEMRNLGILVMRSTKFT